jgi:hypothetical protein
LFDEPVSRELGFFMDETASHEIADLERKVLPISKV